MVAFCIFIIVTCSFYVLAFAWKMCANIKMLNHFKEVVKNVTLMFAVGRFFFFFGHKAEGLGLVFLVP